VLTNNASLTFLETKDRGTGFCRPNDFPVAKKKSFTALNETQITGSDLEKLSTDLILS